MTKVIAINETVPDMSDEVKEELDKLVERMQELTGYAVLMVHPSVQDAVSEICTEQQVDVAEWLMNAIKLNLNIETARQQLIANGEQGGMIAVGEIKIDSDSENRPFAPSGTNLH